MDVSAMTFEEYCEHLLALIEYEELCTDLGGEG